MLRDTSSLELEEWRAFSRLEPFGREIDDLGSSRIVHAIAETNRNPKKHGPFKLKQFLVEWDKPEAVEGQWAPETGGKASTPEGMLNMLSAFTEHLQSRGTAHAPGVILGPDGKPVSSGS